MSQDRSANFSDLDIARRISQRLAAHARDGRGPQPANREAMGYIRFSARGFAPSISPAAELRWENFGIEGWNHILDRCVELVGAEAAFVLDNHGLVIATRLAITPDEAQALGARLQAMLDQAQQLAGEGHGGRAVSLEFNDNYLTGLRAERQGTEFVLGLISADPVRREARAMLERILTAQAP
ncbi:MAG: roadblock/LC7 domain-containing protein [Myxococcales bacterium]|nr:roadblock/LC7 domain-containing protein [Myxococcales bacterium]